MAKQKYKRRGVKTLGRLVPQLTKEALKGKNLTQAKLQAWWPEIIGEPFVHFTRPDRLSQNGTLYLICDPAAALEIQHQSPQILEKVNTWLGYKAVITLKIKQAPVYKPQNTPPAPQKQKDLSDSLQQQLAEIEHKGLKDALARLAGHVD